MYYGKYRGRIVDNNDPEKRGRIKVECPTVLGTQISNWALPCLPPYIFYIPQIGSLVWVEFEEGKIDSPIWSGHFYTVEGWANGAGKFDVELGVIHLPVNSQFINDKKLDVKAKEDTLIETETKLDTKSKGATNITSEAELTTKSTGATSIGSDADINTKSASATNITVGSTLNWSQG